MSKILYCLGCGMIVNTQPFILSLGYNLSKTKEENPMCESLKEEIFFNWVDIEQTEEEYLKFCPICNKWEYHKEMLLGGKNGN